MYRNNNNKTFCKVCKDAGKPESEYTSHSVRANNKVICPTLLATECRYCWQKGHTTKFCPALEAKERHQATEVKQVLPQIQSIKKRGLFDILAEDSDEEEEKEKFPTLKKAPAATIKLSPKITNDFPVLQTKATTTPTPTQMLSGWASIAATPPLQQPVIVQKIVVKKEIKILNWADEESDDEEEQVYTDSW
jgi:hypothetical protein